MKHGEIFHTWNSGPSSAKWNQIGGQVVISSGGPQPVCGCCHHTARCCQGAFLYHLSWKVNDCQMFICSFVEAFVVGGAVGDVMGRPELPEQLQCTWQTTLSKDMPSSVVVQISYRVSLGFRHFFPLICSSALGWRCAFLYLKWKEWKCFQNLPHKHATPEIDWCLSSLLRIPCIPSCAPPTPATRLLIFPEHSGGKSTSCAKQCARLPQHGGVQDSDRQPHYGKPWAPVEPLRTHRYFAIWPKRSQQTVFCWSMRRETWWKKPDGRFSRTKCIIDVNVFGSGCVSLEY